MNELTTQLSFRELVEGLNRHQVEYLHLRLVGHNLSDAMRALKLSENTAHVWRFNNASFRQLEDFLIENRVIYKEQSDRMLEDDIIAVARRFPADVIRLYQERGLEGIPTKFLPYVKWACQYITKVEGEEGSYDELILKRRRKV